MDLNTKVDFSKTVFAQEVDGEMVLLDMDAKNYFGLDEVGTIIWQAIETHNGNLQKVFEVLVETYDVEEDILKNDLIRFIERLIESGLVEVTAL